jgi:hypothetical protein
MTGSTPTSRTYSRQGMATPGANISSSTNSSHLVASQRSGGRPAGRSLSLQTIPVVESLDLKAGGAWHSCRSGGGAILGQFCMENQPSRSFKRFVKSRSTRYDALRDKRISCQAAKGETLKIRELEIRDDRRLLVSHRFRTSAGDLHADVTDDLLELLQAWTLAQHYLDREQGTCCWWRLRFLESVEPPCVSEPPEQKGIADPKSVSILEEINHCFVDDRSSRIEGYSGEAARQSPTSAWGPRYRLNDRDNSSDIFDKHRSLFALKWSRFLRVSPCGQFK